MRYLMQVRIPSEAGNRALRDPQFGERMAGLLADIKAEAAYFSTLDGQRGAYIVVQFDDASAMPRLAEPFFLWLNADVTFLPVMRPEDLGAATPSIRAAVQQWGQT
ncbi:hypothetical protein SAMN02745857_00697 [Andreprevotia lacus DSM 23236]|jgi:hypothetical protein|uniref:Muconolactone delta-isomerase n=1 Tax=Andreprevotia lacus DSM 23236 TaxID=1121001 RepID=A0A1W1X6E8_9NEIS|nr:DUF3303 family protein [Andreprevotia lacus]SMC19397.1 hypothetical protein SAMN02745857_00697 [Andreprevotia lacus DSM 23236]